MSTLTVFFKDSDSQFGIFYPRNYLMAVFPEMTAAEHAKHLLRDGGFQEDDVIAIPGAEVVRFAAELRTKDGVWSILMQQLSRAFGTEERYTDHDLDLASKGAGFVAVYCPTENLKNDAWKTIEPLAPLVARHYTFGGIEHLKGEV